MAIKYGDFVGKNDHEYVVELEGANVEHAALTLGVPPVIISMASSEHKGVGYKSTTAVVNIVTDKPLVDLYASTPTEVKLTVTDMTTGDFLFEGYVTPFAFNQAFTGKADTFTVNAVDLLTARKGEKYANIGEYGTDQPAYAIVEAIAERSGIVRIVEHINFDTIDPDNGTSPLGVMVAQAGFLQDEVSDLDALSAICKFFGYTACVVGNVLYLYDEHCLLNADDLHARNAVVYDYRNGAWVEKNRYFNSANTPLATQQVGTIRNDINVTIERAWDGVQITTEGSDTSVLLPDVCAAENMADNDDILGTSVRTYQDYDKDEDIDYIQWREPRKSKYLVTGNSSADGPVAWTGGDKMRPDDADANYWQNGAIPIRITQAQRTRDKVLGYDVISVDEASPAGMLWLRGYGAQGFVARQRTDKCYSHTGGIVRVKMTYRLLYRSDWQDLNKAVTIDGISAVGMLQVRSGSSYFQDDYKNGVPAAWGATPSGHFLTKGGRLLATNQALERYASDALLVVPNSGAIAVELRWQDGQFATIASPDMYIESLSIEGYGDDMNTSCPDMQHKYTQGGEYVEAKTMLTTRQSGHLGGKYLSVNARPAVVTDTEWSGGYMGRKDTESIPITGVLMEQLKARYGVPRPRYQMTVEGNINPYASVVFGGRGYTVEAYERDLYNDTTNITIN